VHPFGYKVIKLKRIRIDNIKLEGLPIGKWRKLKEEELRRIEPTRLTNEG
jgi:23S rRNA pseudouridine2604 synthase